MGGWWVAMERTTRKDDDGDDDGDNDENCRRGQDRPKDGRRLDRQTIVTMNLLKCKKNKSASDLLICEKVWCCCWPSAWKSWTFSWRNNKFGGKMCVCACLNGQEFVQNVFLCWTHRDICTQTNIHTRAQGLKLANGKSSKAKKNSLINNGWMWLLKHKAV